MGSAIDARADEVLRDGFTILPGHFSADVLQQWRGAFSPLLREHIAREGDKKNRGPGRYYVTLPFQGIWCEPRFFDDDAIVAVVERLVGRDPVMCQLATDTPMLGSEHQDVHRDTPALFPEWGKETPPFQLAVNFPLVDVTHENGPLEIAKGTHMMSKEHALRDLEEGKRKLEPVPMKLGDVMIRDVRALHRGTPNRTDVPRPMVVIGYSRRWLFRPEVSITVPRLALTGLSPRAQHMLRHNTVVESLADAPKSEVYQSYAY
jgi:ectoine hydroxylase-related dioxygenase (phytanoyl-CoA dioxygenase family)